MSSPDDAPTTGDSSDQGREYVPPVWDSWSDAPDDFPADDDPAATMTWPAPRPDDDGVASAPVDPDLEATGSDVDAEDTDELEATQQFSAIPSVPLPSATVPSGPVPSGPVPSATPRRDPAQQSDGGSSEVVEPVIPLPSGRVNQMVGDRYRLEEELAERRHTVTWRAFDTKLSRAVLVHAIADADPRRDAVLEAARKAAIATDSRFLRVLDAVADDSVRDSAYIVCEYVPGQSLEQLLKQGPLSVIEAAWVVRELADALTPMHAAGLFHQMLNPDTVVVTATGSVKIVGFLIDAALSPDEVGDLSWSEREEADVRALGQLLYACLVTRWPTMDQSDTPWWGLRPAPYDAKGWLTPRQVRAGVSPALDQVCDQILHERPRLGGTPLRSAHQIDQSLSRMLGTADASADLEHRVRHPQPSRGLDDTLTAASTEATIVTPQTPTEPAAFDSPHVDNTHLDSTDPAHPHDDDDEDDRSTRLMPAHDGVYGPDNPRERPGATRPWLRLLLGLVLLSVLIGLVAVAVKQAGNGSDQGGATPSSTAAQKLPIAKVDDFDPEADGGNAEENPNQVALAWDGKPATAWTSLTYRGNPKLGGLKPGVGLVVDLGQPVSVGSVKLTLQGTPTAVEIYIPQGDAATLTTPDMSTVERWKQVANNGAASTSVTLKPASPVTTRFVLVYLTSLPKVDEGRYRAGIAEMEVTS